jgi:hypothetical protein
MKKLKGLKRLRGTLCTLIKWVNWLRYTAYTPELYLNIFSSVALHQLGQVLYVKTYSNDFCVCWCYVIRWIWCLWCYSECASTPGNLKSLPDHGGNQTRDALPTELRGLIIPKVAGSIPTVARQTFQFARCGCTRGVTSQTSYAPEYITPTHTEIIIS